MPVFASRRERGMALMMVLVLLIVASVGIIALTRSTSDMQTSTERFGRGDSAYQAAMAGLDLGRGYLAGLTELPGFGTLNLPLADSSGNVNNQIGEAAFAVQLRETSRPAGAPADGDVSSGQGSFIRTTRKWFEVTATGTDGYARRTLRTTYLLEHKAYWSVTEDQTQHNVSYLPLGAIDLACDGDLKMNGKITIGRFHTNEDLIANGQLTFTGENPGGTVVGVIQANVGSAARELIINGQAIGIPAPPEWVCITSGSGVDTQTIGTINGSSNKTISSNAENLLITGKTIINGCAKVIFTGNVKNIYFGGDVLLNGTGGFDFGGCPNLQNLYINGTFTANGNIHMGSGTNLFVSKDLVGNGICDILSNVYATGKITLNGNAVINGIAYAGQRSGTALLMNGNATVNGCIVAKGVVIANGRFQPNRDLIYLAPNVLTITVHQTIFIPGEVSETSTPTQGLLPAGSVLDIPS